MDKTAYVNSGLIVFNTICIIISRNIEKRYRTKNFCTSELSVLVDEVVDKKGILYGPLKGPGLTQFHRDRAWERVLNAVNAVAPAARTVSELKRKLKDLKTRVKAKANALLREHKKTGGGENEAPPLTPLENKILEHLMGRESVEGIPGGVDTYRKNVVQNQSSPSASPSPEPKPRPLHGFLPLPKCSDLELDIPIEFIPPPPSFTDENVRQDPVDQIIIIDPLPEPSTSHHTPAAPFSVPPKKGKKRSAKSAALDELTRNTNTMATTNDLLLRIANSLDSLVELKRREVEFLESGSKI